MLVYSDVERLRADAEGHTALEASVEELASLLNQARDNAGIAVHQGDALAERARKLARSLGIDME